MPDRRPAPLDAAPPAAPGLDRDDALAGASCGRCPRRHPRWGYRKAWASLREQGWEVNRKKIQRLWREEGLRVPPDERKRYRLGDSTTSGASGCGRSGPTTSGRSTSSSTPPPTAGSLKLLHVVDEHTREALAIEVDRRDRRRPHRRVLDRIVRERAGPRTRADGQRPRADRQRPARLVPLRRQRRLLHRARLALGEPVRRVLRPAASATRCSRSKPSTRCSRRRPSLKNGETPTTTLRPHSSLGWQTPAAYAADRRTRKPTRLS